jgi:ionotropic glutamate receptor
MSFVDMKEAEVKRAIRSRDRRLNGSMGGRSYTSEGPSLSRPSSMSPV